MKCRSYKRLKLIEAGVKAAFSSNLSGNNVDRCEYFLFFFLMFLFVDLLYSAESGCWYEVEYIIKQRQSESGDGFDYLVKWKGYGHRDNSWLPESDFKDSNFLVDFNALSNQEKKVREKKAEVALEKEFMKAFKKKKLCGLSIWKIKKRCANNDVFELGRKLFNNKQVERMHLKYEVKVVACVDSEQVAVNFDQVEKNIGEKISCTCSEWQDNRGVLCKHLVAVLYGCCLNQSR